MASSTHRVRVGFNAAGSERRFDPGDLVAHEDIGGSAASFARLAAIALEPLDTDSPATDAPADAPEAGDDA